MVLSPGGRRQFHGSKELFLSDHSDVQSADMIEGKCTVRTFKSYTKLDAFGNDDLFCCFEYNSSIGAFNLDKSSCVCFKIYGILTNLWFNYYII